MLEIGFFWTNTKSNEHSSKRIEHWSKADFESFNQNSDEKRREEILKNGSAHRI